MPIRRQNSGELIGELLDSGLENQARRGRFNLEEAVVNDTVAAELAFHVGWVGIGHH
jgi:hypothetical protein